MKNIDYTVTELDYAAWQDAKHLNIEDFAFDIACGVKGATKRNLPDLQQQIQEQIEFMEDNQQ